MCLLKQGHRTDPVHLENLENNVLPDRFNTGHCLDSYNTSAYSAVHRRTYRAHRIRLHSSQSNLCCL